MKEDLKLKGNDLNLLTTYWTIGYIIGQFPSQMAMTKIRPSLWLPAMEIIWSILTICVAGAKNLNTVYAYIPLHLPFPSAHQSNQHPDSASSSASSKPPPTPEL
jgi:hypothetical protein